MSIRYALSAALAAAIVLATGSTAAAQVTIVPARDAPRTLTAEQLAAASDVSGRSYTVRGAGGERPVTVTGVSLAAMIRVADVDPVFSYLEVERPGGVPVRLAQDQAMGDASFPEGPPVVYVDAGGTTFLRPSSGADDPNEGDLVTGAGGLTIHLRSGPLLEVEASASRVKVDPGEPVRFSADVTRAGAGQELSYSWTLDDGTTLEGPEVTHRFRRAGTYDVTVGVTASGDDAGGSDYVTVVVGKPPKKGPDRKGGGTNTAAGAPDSGAAGGASGGGADSGGAFGSGSVQTPAAPPPPATPAPPTPAAASPPPAPRRAEDAPLGLPRDTVTGRLIAGAIKSQPKSLATALRAARTGVPATASGLDVPTVAWSAAASLALLALGAGLEARFARPRRSG